MKKKNVCMLVAFALVICMALAMAGCANNTVAGKTEPSQSAGNTTQTTEATEATEATETQPTTAEETEAVEEEETEPEIDVSLDLEERPFEEEEPEFDEDEANEE